MPFGADFKDPLWRWGAFLIGVPGFVLLLALMTLGDVWLWSKWWWMWIVLGILMSLRTGRAWRNGETVRRTFAREIYPTVDVKGEPGSTYVLLDKASTGRAPRPRDFGPIWWAVYSFFVRAPVAVGDVVLTLGWRLFGGLGNGGSGALWRGLQMDRVDRPEDMRPPDRDTF